MTQVINMILDALVASVTTKMQTSIDPNDLTYADVVKKGLLQTDKVSKNVQIGFVGGDHNDPEVKDGISSLELMPEIGVDIPSREIGGGQSWWRKGTAIIECYFVRQKLTEDEAFEAGYEVLGRLMSSIEEVNLSGISDDFGEIALHHPYCYANNFFESGGPPKTYIFRGRVFWMCLTERP